MKSKAKNQRANVGALSAKEIVEHPGARTAAAVGALKVAADELYDSVLRLPFELTDPLPQLESDVAPFVAKCREWHDRVVRQFNDAVAACENPISEAVPLSAIVGKPAFGDDSYEGNRDGVRGDLSRHLVAYFDYRVEAVQRSDYRLLSEIGMKSKPVLRQRQAQSFVLDLQLRSRALVRWLYDVLDRHLEMSLPRIIVLGGGLRQSLARVEMAGARRDRPIQDKQRDLLLELATMVPVEISGLYVRTRLYARVRELEGLIHTVDARVGINPTIKLDSRMAGRIKSA